MGETSIVSKYLAEFIGTYALVFTIGCNVLADPATGWAPVSIAAVLCVMIYSMGGASGAQFNPAVSAAILMSGKMTLVDFAGYIVSQLAGGVAGAFSFTMMFDNKKPALFPAGMNGEGEEFTKGQAALAEFLYTAMLCYTVLSVAVASSSAGNQYFGLAISGNIIAGGYAVGGISGGAFNPAVAIPIDIVSGDFSGDCALWTAAELGGAALAAALFRVVRPEDFGAEDKKNGLPQKLTAELIGTFFLTLTAGFAGLGGAPGYAVAASLMVMIYANGNVSGGMFNPAVAAAVFFSGRNKISASDVGAYIGAQFAGACLAAVAFTMCVDMHVPTNANLFDKEKVAKTIWAEIFYTFVLCYTILCVATVKNPLKDFFGLAISTVITAVVFAAGQFAVSLNPAVSLGMGMSALVKGELDHAGNLPFYFALELVGAGLAAGVFRVIYPEEFEDDAPIKKRYSHSGSEVVKAGEKGASFSALAPPEKPIDEPIPPV